MLHLAFLTKFCNFAFNGWKTSLNLKKNHITNVLKKITKLLHKFIYTEIMEYYLNII